MVLTISGVVGPGAPRSVRAKLAGVDGIHVSWEEPESNGGADITDHTVQWKRATGDWTLPEDVSEAAMTTTAYTVTGLSAGVQYSVRVFATNRAGNGMPSAEATATLNSPATGRPAISGEAQVGRMLTAGTTGISDADGMTGAAFSYQWIRTPALRTSPSRMPRRPPTSFRTQTRVMPSGCR